MCPHRNAGILNDKGNSTMPASPQPDDRRPDVARALRADLLLVGGALAVVAVIFWGIGWLSPRTRVVRKPESARRLLIRLRRLEALCRAPPGRVRLPLPVRSCPTLRPACANPAGPPALGGANADP